MTALKASHLVPKLRFPEFRNEAEWKTKILGTQGSFLSSLTGKTAQDFDIGDSTFIPYVNVLSNAFTNTTDLRSVHVADDEAQNAVAKGDVFFTASSGIPEEVGMSSILLEEIGNCYLNSFCALFRFGKGKSPNPIFLGYLLRSALTREYLSRGAQGITFYNISRKTLRGLPILIPSSPEQQKIADCLGSLDALITAEGRKLEVLRQHKQGLMQQLFPQPGETVPRLRFLEFRDAATWDIRSLGELAHVIAGQSPSGVNYNTIGKGTPFYQGKADFGDIYIKAPTKWTTQVTKLAQPSDILMSVRAPVGALNISTEQICIGRGLASLQARCDKWFLYYLLLSQKGRIVGNGGSVFDSINKKQIEELLILVPHTIAEQQKIADCLVSLDDLIAAEGRKLEALRQHKQGLMQQLFPSLETKPR